ncbi:MAG: hypothetical protein LQ345_001010 [Seirophora villosa]|nr:MAG: hypothetical protein LQ345_001010 [Seirophora villosa]
MQYSLACFLWTAASLAPRTCAQTDSRDRLSKRTAPSLPQQVMNLPLPGFSSSSTDAGDLILSDVIGKDRSINVFAGFTRDIDTISKVVEDKSQNATVLAPLNSELQKLPRKPWEDPEDYEILGQSAYEGSAGEDRAHRNLRRFVEAHVVLASPWREGEKRKSVGGGELWWEDSEGTRIVCSA